MAVENLLTMATPLGALLVIAVLGVLWKYSALPKLDWKYFTVAAMLFFMAAAIGVFAAVAQGSAQTITQVQGVLAALGAVFVVVGALLNLVEAFKK